jgi:hypothetical protein
MMVAPTELCRLENVPVWQDPQEFDKTRPNGRVHFVADADIDADGANGQTTKNGQRLFAYAPEDKGVDLLRNAGYPNGGYRDILVCGSNNSPIVFGAGGYYSKTAWFDSSKTWDDPNRYLDSASVPYIVVEGFIRRRAKGVVLGCQARVSVLDNEGKITDSTWAVVGDIGPLYKLGEISMSAADGIAIDSNPRTGGTDKRIVLYEMWPGVPAFVNGKTYDLIRAV